MVASLETPETIAAGFLEMIRRLRAGTIGAPNEEVVQRYDARCVAETFDKVVKGRSRELQTHRAPA